MPPSWACLHHDSASFMIAAKTIFSNLVESTHWCIKNMALQYFCWLPYVLLFLAYVELSINSLITILHYNNHILKAKIEYFVHSISTNFCHQEHEGFQVNRHSKQPCNHQDSGLKSKLWIVFCWERKLIDSHFAYMKREEENYRMIISIQQQKQTNYYF